jgi:hypothetical protein
MSRRLQIWIASLIVFLSQRDTQSVAPRVLSVPGQYATIQQAIDSARRGDTVLVAPGRYYENIRLKGRSVVLTSLFARTRNPADIAATIIDGSRPAHPDTASVVRIVNLEDSTTVIQGFTITGGKGTVWLDAKAKHEYREGGGILCELSSPTIRFNIIERNEAVAVGPGINSAGGGGIRCGYAEPTIENNVIRDNRARYGAGVVLFHSASIVRNNLIVNNSGGEDYGGAGLWIAFALSRRLATEVEHNTIAYNHASAGASAQTGPMQGLAGGVWTSFTRLVFRNNIVWGNTQAKGDQFDFQLGTPLHLGRNIVEGGINGGPTVGETLLLDPRFADLRRFEVGADSPAQRGGRVELGAYSGPGSFRLLP